MSTMTNLQRSVDSRLREQGTTLPEWLAGQRAEGISYQQMSVVLFVATGDRVSDETLRSWVDRLAEPTAAAS